MVEQEAGELVGRFNTVELGRPTYIETGKTRQYVTISDFPLRKWTDNERSNKENCTSLRENSANSNGNEPISLVSPLGPGVAAKTNSSDIIATENVQFVHQAPFPGGVDGPLKSVRNEVIRRNGMYGSSLNSLTSYMEERLIRWRPSMSQNNVEDTLSGRHAFYQLSVQNYSEPIETDNYWERVATVFNKKRQTTSIPPTSPKEMKNHAKTIPSPVEDFSQYSQQDIARQYNTRPQGETPIAQPVTEKDLETLFPILYHQASIQDQTEPTETSQTSCVNWSQLWNYISDWFCM